MINAEKIAELNRRYEAFIDECDRREESDRWDVENNGQMEMYISNELTCILLRLSASDGEISDNEVQFINAVLGMEYTAPELKSVYEEMKENIDDYSVEGISGDLEELKEDFPELAAGYALIICDACQMLVESDGDITEEEMAEAKKLMEAIGI